MLTFLPSKNDDILVVHIHSSQFNGCLMKMHLGLHDGSCSSFASCIDCRFVELLWQLSLHALREVHRRTFAADVASNPLPASLTDVAFSHAATLLPVTKVVLTCTGCT